MAPLRFPATKDVFQELCHFNYAFEVKRFEYVLLCWIAFRFQKSDAWGHRSMLCDAMFDNKPWFKFKVGLVNV